MYPSTFHNATNFSPKNKINCGQLPDTPPRSIVISTKGRNLKKIPIFPLDLNRYSVIVIYNINNERKQTIFIRIEPSSATPIYRQVSDQIKYLLATGSLKEGDKLPSVRELASTLAVNQNTILKVYNELTRQNLLKIERGDGTYVSSGKQNIPSAERKSIIAAALREAAVLAVQLDLPLDQTIQLLEKEYNAIKSAKNKSEEIL